MPSFRQRAATHAAPDRSQPRHRPCHRNPLFLAPAGASSPARGMRSRKTARGTPGLRITSRSILPTMPTPRGRSAKSASGSKAARCMRWSTTPRFRRRARAARGSAPWTPTSTTWSHVFRVNFFAPIMMARGLIEELKAAKGSVVNVTSIAGSRVHPFAGAAYATSKAALASLTREMASDFGRVGVRVNSIAPGEIDTSILSPGTEKIVEQQIPMHRLGTPDEVAKIIYVLCTETSLLRERRRDPHQRRPARVADPTAHRLR